MHQCEPYGAAAVWPPAAGGDAAVPDCEVGLGATCPPVADDTAVGPAVRVAMRYWGTSIRDVVGLAVRVPRLRSLTIVDQVENRVEVAFFHRGRSSLEIPKLNRVSKFRNSVNRVSEFRNSVTQPAGALSVV